MANQNSLHHLFIILPTYNPSKTLFNLAVSSLLSEVARSQYLYTSICLLISLNDKSVSQDLFASVLCERLQNLFSACNNLTYYIFSNLSNDGYPLCFINLIQEALNISESNIRPSPSNIYLTFFDQDDYVLPGRLKLFSNHDLHYSRDILSSPSFVRSTTTKSSTLALDRPPSAGHSMTISKALASSYILQTKSSIIYARIAHDLGLYLVALQNDMTFFDQNRISMVYIQHSNQTIPVPTPKRLLNIKFLKSYLQTSAYYISCMAELLLSLPAHVFLDHRISSNRIKRVILQTLLLKHKAKA